MGPPHLETVNRLLYDTYHNYEPLTKYLGLCKGLNSLRDVDREVEQILVKNLTLLAFDDDGKPVGVAVNNSCCKDEMKVTMEEALKGVEENVNLHENSEIGRMQCLRSRCRMNRLAHN